MADTTAILLRRMDFGENDLILTMFTRDQGKTSVIAKSAKKSRKRFAGALDLFSVSRILYTKGRGRLPILTEAALKHVFLSLRTDICKAAYASYWAELIYLSMEEQEKQSELYGLFVHALDILDKGSIQNAELNILFQMEFLRMSGIFPVLENCIKCRVSLDCFPGQEIFFDLSKGGPVCQKCCQPGASFFISKGTLKQLAWLGKNGFTRPGRVRFSRQSMCESRVFLESFISCHLGKCPKSLKFLSQIGA